MLENRAIIYGDGPTYPENALTDRYPGRRTLYPFKPTDVRATFVDNWDLPSPVLFKELLPTLPREIFDQPLPPTVPYLERAHAIYGNFFYLHILPIAKHLLAAKGIIQPLLARTTSSGEPTPDFIFIQENYPPYPDEISQTILHFAETNPQLYRALLQLEMLAVLADSKEERIQLKYRAFAREVKKSFPHLAHKNAHREKTRSGEEQVFYDAFERTRLLSYAKMEPVLKEVDALSSEK